MVSGFLLAQGGGLWYAGSMATDEERSVTRAGNPAKPTGTAGAEMLARMNNSHAEVTEWGLAFLPIAADAAVLDIGCGGGATLHRLAMRAPQGRITGVDYSEVSVACSQEFNRADIASGRMQVIQGSVENLPFADNAFDIITTVESFYFWPAPQENLREVCRVLKPGGRFLLIAEIHEDGSLPEQDRRNIELYRLFNPTRTEFETLFRNAGFTAVQSHTKAGEHWIAVSGRKV